MERAAWHGTRIILRQTSPEAEDIFDMIISLHSTCRGDWRKLADRSGLDYSDVEAFLDYAACFLSNVGNYYASLSDSKYQSWFTNTAQGIWRPEIHSKASSREAVPFNCDHSKSFIFTLATCRRYQRYTAFQSRFPK